MCIVIGYDWLSGYDKKFLVPIKPNLQDKICVVCGSPIMKPYATKFCREVCRARNATKILSEKRKWKRKQLRAQKITAMLENSLDISEQNLLGQNME